MAIFVKNNIDHPLYVTITKDWEASLSDFISELGQLVAAILSGVEEIKAAGEGLVTAIKVVFNDGAEIGDVLASFLKTAEKLAEELEKLGEDWVKFSEAKGFVASVEGLWNMAWRTRDLITSSRNLIKELERLEGRGAKIVEDAIHDVIEKLDQLIEKTIGPFTVEIPPKKTVDVLEEFPKSGYLDPSYWEDKFKIPTLSLVFKREVDSYRYANVLSTRDTQWEVSDEAVTRKYHYFWHSGETKYPWSRSLPAPDPLPENVLNNDRHAVSMAVHENILHMVFVIGNIVHWARSKDGKTWTNPEPMQFRSEKGAAPKPVHAASGMDISEATIRYGSGTKSKSKLYGCYHSGSQYKLICFSKDDDGQYWGKDNTCARFDLLKVHQLSEDEGKKEIIKTPVLDGQKGGMTLYVNGIGKNEVERSWIRMCNLSLLWSNAYPDPDPVLFLLTPDALHGIISSDQNNIGTELPASEFEPAVCTKRRFTMMWQGTGANSGKPLYLEPYQPWDSHTYTVEPLTSQLNSHLKKPIMIDVGDNILCTMWIEKDPTQSDGRGPLRFVLSHQNEYRKGEQTKFKMIQKPALWNAGHTAHTVTRHRPAAALFNIDNVQNLFVAWRDPDDENLVWWNFADNTNTGGIPGRNNSRLGRANFEFAVEKPKELRFKSKE